jgi:hypothetical protein
MYLAEKFPDPQKEETPNKNVPQQEHAILQFNQNHRATR